MNKLNFVVAVLFFPAAAMATWDLTGLVYHGYCPPAAIGTACEAGQDFDASNYIGRPRVVGEYTVNRMTQDGSDIEMASWIRVPYFASGKARLMSYMLVQRFSDVGACDLLTNSILDVVGINGEQVIMLGKDGCDLAVRAEFLEASNYPRELTWDATMTFTNSECSDE